jgi:hypothetical protein
MADRFRATHIALGYSGYQSGWAEQTPYAIKKLGEVLTSNGFSLVLPVADVQNKVDAIKELEANKLSTEALEQKCVRQIIDPGLTGENLYQEVDVWSHRLKEAMSERAKGNLEIVTVYKFNDPIIENVYPTRSV